MAAKTKRLFIEEIKEMPFTISGERVERVECAKSENEHIPYARLQAIARRVDWLSVEEEIHLAICDECRSKIEKMKGATLGI